MLTKPTVHLFAHNSTVVLRQSPFRAIPLVSSSSSASHRFHPTHATLIIPRGIMERRLSYRHTRQTDKPFMPLYSPIYRREKVDTTQRESMNGWNKTYRIFREPRMSRWGNWKICGRERVKVQEKRRRKTAESIPRLNVGRQSVSSPSTANQKSPLPPRRRPPPFATAKLHRRPPSVLLIM